MPATSVPSPRKRKRWALRSFLRLLFVRQNRIHGGSGGIDEAIPVIAIGRTHLGRQPRVITDRLKSADHSRPLHIALEQVDETVDGPDRGLEVFEVHSLDPAP